MDRHHDLTSSSAGVVRMGEDRVASRMRGDRVEGRTSRIRGGALASLEQGRGAVGRVFRSLVPTHAGPASAFSGRLGPEVPGVDEKSVTLTDQEERMQRNRGWAALRTALTAAVALGAIATVPAFANASTSTGTDATTTTSARSPGLQNIFTYSTSGQIDPSQGVNGANVISFDSVPLQKSANQVNSFVTPTSFSLGAFRVGTLPDGQMTSYTDTPFSITFVPQTINGDAMTAGTMPVVLSGVLNGTVSGPGQSDVVATFKPTGNSTDPTAQQFSTMTSNGSFANTLRILSDKVALVPSTSYGGLTTVQGQVISSGSPIPEPATIALFLTAAAGLGLRRRMRRRAL